MNQILVFLLASAICGLAASAATNARPFHTVDFEHFWDLVEIDDFIHDLEEEFPTLVSVEEYGHTDGDNHIEAIVVRKGAPKATIVIEAGLRAREWLAPMAALYFIHQIVEHSADYQNILDKVDFVFIPVANPDGYQYSHTTDRNWIKNRRMVSSTCFGADLNRNFQYHFTASNDPCNENYSGPYYFSEAETKAVRDVLTTYQDRVKMYLSLQATGQQIVIPYNHYPSGSTSELQLTVLGNKVRDAIEKVNGRRYTVGVGGILNGVEYGTPLDYSYESRRIQLSYALRLPSGGSRGWDFPEAQLSGVMREAFDGFLVLATHVASL